MACDGSLEEFVGLFVDILDELWETQYSAILLRLWVRTCGFVCG
jgi:hypothetical protein